jgi:site-specific DNA recombinase
VSRIEAERILLDEMRRRLLAPEMVKQMAEELRAEYEGRLKDQAADDDKTPKELVELGKRLARLRRRLRTGDPDLSADDLQTAIEKAERYRLELLHAQQHGARSGKAGARRLYAALPNAAHLYERQIARGLTGKSEHVTKARALLKELFGGQIVLRQTPKGLIARSALHRDVLLRGDTERKSGGSGGSLRAL